MLRCLLLALTCGALQAAAIRGTVVEKQSGKPLARALVVVQPLAGSGGATASVRTNPNGNFEFPALPAGWYLVTASKTGFASAEYGQTRPSSAGTPVTLTESGAIETRLALPHFGAISGRVIDENSVGIPNCTVVVYRNTRPPEVVGRASTDDRGVYRVSGLSPGGYLARTAAIEDATGVHLPTFGRESLTVGGASSAEAMLDRDTLYADVRPIAGRLVTVAGRVSSPGPARASVTVTLVSDMGSQSQTTGLDGRFTFDRVAPGAYDIYAQGADTISAKTLTAWQPVELGGDRSGIALDLAPLPSVQFSFVDASGKRVDPTGLPFLTRRKELSGPGAVEYLRLDSDGQARLDPGRWLVALGPNASWYVARVTGAGAHASSGTAAGWNEIAVAPGNAPLTVECLLSPHTAKLRGAVAGGGQPASGAPVYLEAIDPDSGRRWGDLRTTRAGVDGRYTFAGLAPGLYRVASTFDYQAPDSAAMSQAGAREVTIEEGREAGQDLDLWVMP
jgi:protocatechuate 3,4-dioxygenase beta subunit